MAEWPLWDQECPSDLAFDPLFYEIECYQEKPPPPVAQWPMPPQAQQYLAPPHAQQYTAPPPLPVAQWFPPLEEQQYLMVPPSPPLGAQISTPSQTQQYLMVPSSPPSITEFPTPSQMQPYLMVSSSPPLIAEFPTPSEAQQYLMVPSSSPSIAEFPTPSETQQYLMVPSSPPSIAEFPTPSEMQPYLMVPPSITEFPTPSETQPYLMVPPSIAEFPIPSETPQYLMGPPPLSPVVECFTPQQFLVVPPTPPPSSPPPAPVARCSTSPQAQQPVPPPRPLSPISPTMRMLFAPKVTPSKRTSAHNKSAVTVKKDNPRELRNKAEKERRDTLNQSVAELASIVPPVVASDRKIDKIGVLKLTAHYLRAYEYVFGDAIEETAQKPRFSKASAQAVLGLFNGFLLTTTYKGLVVVVSRNVDQYLGYSELDLVGQNIFSITHPEDLQTLKDQLMPKHQTLGPQGELLAPYEPDGKRKVAESLTNEKRSFVIRFKKYGQRSEPPQYVTCHVEGTMRKSDAACQWPDPCCKRLKRVRAREINPYSSGNDIVFIGIVRPMAETFMSERNLEWFKMEYRTRHSVDGEIIQCDQRISLVTGYMTQEVLGINAMNFMHRNDVRWVIVVLRQMYDNHRLVGESCYRLITKSGHFIYMRTRGSLVVEDDTKAVRSFVCVNTMVDEEEGKYMIKKMKEQSMLLINCTEEPPADKDAVDNNVVPVEDPRNLSKVILHLFTDLPSFQSDRGESRSLPFEIIPPERERTVTAIHKIHSVIKLIRKDTGDMRNLKKQKTNPPASTMTPNYNRPTPARDTMIDYGPSTSRVNNSRRHSHTEYNALPPYLLIPARDARVDYGQSTSGQPGIARRHSRADYNVSHTFVPTPARDAIVHYGTSTSGLFNNSRRHSHADYVTHTFVPTPARDTRVDYGPSTSSIYTNSRRRSQADYIVSHTFVPTPGKDARIDYGPSTSARHVSNNVSYKPWRPNNLPSSSMPNNAPISGKKRNQNKALDLRVTTKKRAVETAVDEEENEKGEESTSQKREPSVIEILEATLDTELKYMVNPFNFAIDVGLTKYLNNEDSNPGEDLIDRIEQQQRLEDSSKESSNKDEENYKNK